MGNSIMQIMETLILWQIIFKKRNLWFNWEEPW